MRHGASLAFVIIALACTAATLPAAGDPCTTRTLPVTVVDQKGNLVTDLTAADFRGTFRGQPVHINSAELDKQPRRIVIVLDASGSMISNRYNWTTATAVAEDFVRLAVPRHSVGCVIFASGALERIGVSANAVTLLTRVGALRHHAPLLPKGQGKTALLDAIAAAVDLLQPPRVGDVIYLITDAGENQSRTKPDEVEDTLSATATRLFAVVVQGAVERRDRESLDGRELLLSVAHASGGNMVRLPPTGAFAEGSSKRAEKARANVLLELTSMYLQMDEYYALNMELPPWGDKVRDWKLQVMGENGKPKRDLAVLYPHKLMPCKMAQKNN